MVIVINYNNSKSESLKKALKDLQVDFKYSDNEFEICHGEKLILPGYGAASDGIKKIHLFNLFTILRVIKKPLLGIGLGMEILCDHSNEGNVSCLGVVGGDIKMFEKDVSEIPFEGNKSVEVISEGRLMSGIPSRSNFYFNNSYYLPLNQYSIASAKNNETIFSAAIEKNNFYGVQFHPEDSGEPGLKVLSNFLQLK